MDPILEISGNHIIWHRRPSANRSGWRNSLGYLLGKKRLAVEGSFGRDIYLASFVIPERVRKFIWFSLLFLFSLKFYFFRELVAGLIMISAFAFAVSLPLLLLLTVYKTGQNMVRREGIKSMATMEIRKTSAEDLQLEELLCRLALNQMRSRIRTGKPLRDDRTGLILNTELPGCAS